MHGTSASLLASAAPTPVSPPLAWLVVVHPNAELAELRADRFRQLLTGTEVSATASGTAALAKLDRGDDHGLILVHLAGVDRYGDGWPGHRILERAARLGGDRAAAAWIDSRDLDARAVAALLGVGVVHRLPAGGPRGGVQRPAWPGRPQAAMVSASVSFQAAGVPATDPDLEAEFASWFERRYKVSWRPWFELALAEAAGGGETKEQVERLAAVLDPDDEGTAKGRLRRIGQHLSGEVRGDDALIAREALVVLAKLTHVRPLVAEPYAARSLLHTVERLDADTTLARDARITDRELEDVQSVAARVAARASRSARRGRPAAGEWRVRRRAALVDIAKELSDSGAERAAIRDRLERTVDRVLDAVHDVLVDRDAGLWWP